MPSELNIEVEKPQDGVVVARPVGEVDLASSPNLRTSLSQIVAESPARLIIDLSKVPYMDSSGVATLVEALQQSRKHSTVLVLASLQDRVRSVFEIARLDTVFDIQPDMKSAFGD